MNYAYWEVKLDDKIFAVRVDKSGYIDAAPPVAGDVVGRMWQNVRKEYVIKGAVITLKPQKEAQVG